MKGKSIPDDASADSTELHFSTQSKEGGKLLHYEVPNLRSMLYEYTNREQEVIQECFRTGNFTSLRELPDRMEPNSVIDKLRSKQEYNIHF